MNNGPQTLIFGSLWAENTQEGESEKKSFFWVGVGGAVGQKMSKITILTENFDLKIFQTKNSLDHGLGALIFFQPKSPKFALKHVYQIFLGESAAYARNLRFRKIPGDS